MPFIIVTLPNLSTLFYSTQYKNNHQNLSISQITRREKEANQPRFKTTLPWPPCENYPSLPLQAEKYIMSRSTGCISAVDNLGSQSYESYSRYLEWTTSFSSLFLAHRCCLHSMRLHVGRRFLWRRCQRKWEMFGITHVASYIHFLCVFRIG